MITYDPNNILRIICRMEGSILLAVWPEMLLACTIAIGSCFLRQWQGEDEYIITDIKGHATLGTTLAFLNVFRSNLSYGRYWDGRGQLGFLVRSGRELMRTCVTYTRIPEDRAEEEELASCLNDIKRLVNCLHHSIVLAVQNYDDHPPFDPPYDIELHLVSKGWLRTDEKNAIEKAEGERRDSSKAYGEPGGPDNKGRPALIACLLSQKVYWLYHKGWMSSAVLKKCDTQISTYVGAWMAMEKICGTPMVFPYTQMLAIFMMLFVFTFPIPLAHVFWNEDVPVNGFVINTFIAGLVAFAFFGMNAVGVEIENPFGEDANDLPVEQMMKRVEKDTASLLELRTASDQHAAMESYREKLLAAEAERAAAEKRRLAGGPPKTPARR